MLEVEQRYQAPHAAFQKYEKIRIEQWVSSCFSIYFHLVQETMLSDSEPAVEKE